MRLKYVLAGLWLAAACTSCGVHGEPGGYFQMPNVRNVQFSLNNVNHPGKPVGWEPPAGLQEAPFEVYGNFSWELGPSQQDGGHTYLTAVKRFEVDYGDGQGWEDVTAKVMTLQSNINQYPTGIPAQAFPEHTYQSPGSFVFHWRVTWWDGSVLYDGDLDYHLNPGYAVVVTAPAA